MRTNGLQILIPIPYIAAEVFGIHWKLEMTEGIKKHFIRISLPSRDSTMELE